MTQIKIFQLPRRAQFVNQWHCYSLTDWVDFWFQCRQSSAELRVTFLTIKTETVFAILEGFRVRKKLQLTGLSVSGPSPLCWARSKLGPYWLPPTWWSLYYVKIIWWNCEEDHTRKACWTNTDSHISRLPKSLKLFTHTMYINFPLKNILGPKYRFSKRIV